MSAVLDLLRPELRSLQPYPVDERAAAAIYLNANEVPWCATGDTQNLNRYPEPQSLALRKRLADIHAVDKAQILLTRGSDDAIDWLIRAFCRPGRDAIVTLPPTFSMYAQFAALNAVSVFECPLQANNDFLLDVERVLSTCDEVEGENLVRLVFICSPNNPTGNLQAPDQIATVCQALKNRAIVVVDEAYQEFACTPGCVPLLAQYDNLVVLRTLSKAYALAAARCGVVLGAPELVQQLGALLPPYPMPAPSVSAALQAMQPENLETTKRRIDGLLDEREALHQRLRLMPCIKKVWRSDANFLLVETDNADKFCALCEASNIYVRAFSNDAGLADCVRITIGSAVENDQLMAALEKDNVAV